MGLVWLTHPVIWHSSRVASGYNYSAMTPEQIELLTEKWHFVRFHLVSSLNPSKFTLYVVVPR